MPRMASGAGSEKPEKLTQKALGVNARRSNSRILQTSFNIPSLNSTDMRALLKVVGVVVAAFVVLFISRRFFQSETMTVDFIRRSAREEEQATSEPKEDQQIHGFATASSKIQCRSPTFPPYRIWSDYLPRRSQVYNLIECGSKLGSVLVSSCRALIYSQVTRPVPLLIIRRCCL